MSTSHFLSIPDTSQIDSICLGSGRFLRSVLIPALNGAGLKSAIFQTRGRSFLEHIREKHDDTSSEFSYEVDTVGYDGSIKTENVVCYGVGTFGSEEGKDAAIRLLEQMKCIRVIGVGVTEAGLSSSSSKALIDLTDLLHKCHFLISTSSLTCPNPNNRICIINTDNVPTNGQMIRSHVLDIAKKNHGGNEEFLTFLKEQVIFHDSMVDRITSQREGSNGMVPSCEPVPAKAIVLADLKGDLPSSLCQTNIKDTYGVVVRTEEGQLNGDIALKLRVANGTHTAIAHVMALSSLLLTDTLSNDEEDSGSSLLMKYLDAFFSFQILQGAEESYGKAETQEVYDDWRKRLRHPHFGLSTFFITQNGAAKGGIRIAPTVRSLLASGKDVTVSTAFCLAAILRFLTPAILLPSAPNTIYRGWLDGKSRTNAHIISTPDISTTYADGLQYNLVDGWYEFKCNCMVRLPNTSIPKPLPEVLAKIELPGQPQTFEDVVVAYLTAKDGGNMKDLMEDKTTTKRFQELVCAVSTLYSRMTADDGALNLLQEMVNQDGIYDKDGLNTPCRALIDGAGRNVRDKHPLHYRKSPIPDHSNLISSKVGIDHDTITSVIFSEVSSVIAIDLHTHLLPPSHGALCLWGIDELLTYHYLVAEYFMTAPASMTPDKFYALHKHAQADIIWKALFIDRSPISEACRGVITTLKALGLQKEIDNRDLEAVRKYYHTFREEGLEGAERFSEMVYKKAGIKYAVMTNIPFDINEVKHWRPKRKEYPEQYKSALRVDPLLAGDQAAIESALKSSGYELTLEGARQYLRDWCDTMHPEYMMASTPHNFVFTSGGNLFGIKKIGLNEDAMETPGAFADLSNIGNDRDLECDENEDETASIIDEKSDFLSEVLMKVCEERDLPVALKIGAHRGVNPQLKQAGDGVVAFADANVLARLCTRFPNVRFLATFLSKNNQHEACVLASKFRNLHVYGCWWFCNNPSLIEEITKMRVEMLGTAFTAQHSDARVLDQLIYKWAHSRAVIANVLAKEYIKLSESGWLPSRKEIRKDIERLFGESYEEFMRKSFAA